MVDTQGGGACPTKNFDVPSCTVRPKADHSLFTIDAKQVLKRLGKFMQWNIK